MNILTKLDEGNGDYYPYMDIKNFGMDEFIPDLLNIQVNGGTAD